MTKKGKTVAYPSNGGPQKTYDEQKAEYNEKIKQAEDLMSEDKKFELRSKAATMGVEIAVAKGAPHHAVYIAADFYGFMLTGIRPLGPPPARSK